MKLTKKIIVAALAVVGLTFAGCNMNLDKHNMIDFDAPGNHAEIDFTNNTESMQRAWKTFNSKHRLGTCVVEYNKAKGAAGNMGFIWGLEDQPENTCNFYVATIAYGKSANTNGFNYYISRFEGVGKDYLEGTTENFCDKDGKVIGSSGCSATETKIVPTGSAIWSSLSDIDSTGKVAFVLTWTQNQGYTISLYPDANSDGTGKGSLITSKNISAGLTSDEKADNKAPDKGFGVYAMCNKGKNLKGTWDFPGLTATSAVVEE